MTIDLYTTNSPNIQVDKALTAIASVSGYLKEPCTRKDPVIVFKKEDITNLELCNYIYIADFRRYYYRGVIEQDAGDVRVKFSEDVLMSWKNEIRLNSATVSRNANLSNGYLVDPNYKAYAYRECVTRQFPVALDTDSLILITVG